MAEIFASLLGPVIELGKCIVAPIKRQFNYLCCFNSNIQSLRDEAQKLEDARVGLQMQVDAAENNAEEIVPQVKTWLANTANQINITEIENEIPKARRSFLNVKSRYSTSRKAKKKTEAMKELRDSCNFNPISQPARPASMVSLPLGSIHEVPSRKQLENDIIEALRVEKVNILGICGMGGVGKTTLAKSIMNRVREVNLFDEAVMAIVSKPVDMFRIQQEIGESLGITNWQMERLEGRKQQLRDRLMGKKRILLVLDDLWESLKLDDLGIPCQNELHKGCTILFTTRRKEVSNKMDAKKVFAVKTLSDIEAWRLFREKVGACVDDLDLHSIATEVVQECKGLPLALTVVGTTLKSEIRKHIWEDALQQLKSSNPIDMPDVLEEVYKPIKLSYDFLNSPRARSLFLLCCLFPEDYDIHIDYLTSYGMGLGIFEGLTNVELTRNRVRTLVKMLKGHFLLLDGRNENHVKMHDVVRDVAIFIASEEGRVSLNFSLIDYSREGSINCTWISVEGEKTIELAIKLIFPRLRLLLINNSRQNKQIQLGDPCFFQGMIELKVLSLGSISFRSLPQTIELLQNLRTLFLEDCHLLETISIVGQLLGLEILICRGCNKIAELPMEIGRLKRLKMLEVYSCKRLQRIVPGVISNLVQLEELKIMMSFGKWEAKGKGKERNNADLGELELLSNLTRLEIQIEDFTLAAQEICFSSKIVKYNIQVRRISSFDLRESEKYMLLNLEKEITLGTWVHVFLKNAEHLHVFGYGSSSLGLAQAQNMKFLIYRDCPLVKKLVNVTKSVDWSLGVFPHLESLEISNLDNLEEICKLPKASNSFGNLKELTLWELPTLVHIWKSPHQSVSLRNLSSINLRKCGKLRRLFPLAIAKDGLLQLEELKISDCEMMEKVFSNEENEKDGDRCHISFPKLKDLELDSLPRLTALCKGSESIEFPLLHRIFIKGCQKLTSLSCTSDNLNLKGHDDDSLHLFCDQKISFGSLKEVRLEGYKTISNICYQIRRSLISSSIAENLVNLKELVIIGCDLRKLFPLAIAKNGLLQLELLTIENCEKMEEVFSNEENEKDGDGCHISFPKLRNLELDSLPRLTAFCKGSESIEFPLLNRIFIKGCQKLTSLSCTSDNLNLEGHDEDSLHLFCDQKISFGSLKEVNLQGYNSISNIWCHQIPLDFFSQIEELRICDSSRIGTLFSSLIAENLVNLKELTIIRCHIHKLFHATVIKDGLLQLENLVIENCEMLEAVVSNEVNETDGDRCHISFPKLRNLDLDSLPRLTAFCKGSESIEFPLLNKIRIKACQKMTSLVCCTWDSPNLAGHDDGSFHLFCNQKVSFGSLRRVVMVGNDIVRNIWCHQIPLGFFSLLERLEICSFHGIKSFFSFSVAENLVNLKRLTVQECKEMEILIEDEEMICERLLLFPSLEYLNFIVLPKLQSFCKCRCDLQLPSLKYVNIFHCPLLEFLSMGSLITPNLDTICIDTQEKDTEDFNGAVRLHFEANHKKSETEEEKEINEETTSAEAKEVETEQKENL